MGAALRRQEPAQLAVRRLRPAARHTQVRQPVAGRPPRHRGPDYPPDHVRRAERCRPRAAPWRRDQAGRDLRLRPRAKLPAVGSLIYASAMRVALCQLPVSSEPAVNLGRVQAAVADAASQGAGLAVFPEATLARFGSDLRAAAEPLDVPFCRGLSMAARDAGVAVVAGTFEPAPGGRVYNTVVAYDAAGGLAASYRKIHLYDALGQRESELVAAGDEPVLFDLGGLSAGIMTCYDVRFPELARVLAAGGAGVIGGAGPGAGRVVMGGAW